MAFRQKNLHVLSLKFDIKNNLAFKNNKIILTKMSFLLKIEISHFWTNLILLFYELYINTHCQLKLK